MQEQVLWTVQEIPQGRVRRFFVQELTIQESHSPLEIDDAGGGDSCAESVTVRLLPRFLSASEFAESPL